MATVLLPSNFQNDSFSCVPELVETFPGMPLKVLFFHPFGLSSSITELLMLSRRSREETLVSFDFFRQCRALEKAYPEVTVNWTCFYGTTMVAFKRFLEANAIDFIASPASYQYQAIGKQSLNPSLFLAKCGLPVIQITPQELALTGIE
ncbi:hypothetical protein [Rufibacter latericius]|uniref:Uncharacterized protein n=1 Tax=Rufibacter latericius TaxID=2487040 RepID=A0A3M9MYN4_9BACT|nr:hypothetical protein [Rufibacter latericius]RNI30644.1 hypothetical protein EFB08_05175 [Rufibacter latericius]